MYQREQSSIYRAAMSFGATGWYSLSGSGKPEIRKIARGVPGQVGTYESILSHFSGEFAGSISRSAWQ
jgi:hypothetical protein